MPNAIEAAADLPEIPWYDLPTEEVPQPDYIVGVPANPYVNEVIGLDADELALSQRPAPSPPRRGLLDMLATVAFGTAERLVARPLEVVFENFPVIGVAAVIFLGLAFATQVLVDVFMGPFQAIAP